MWRCSKQKSESQLNLAQETITTGSNGLDITNLLIFTSHVFQKLGENKVTEDKSWLSSYNTRRQGCFRQALTTDLIVTPMLFNGRSHLA